MFFRDSGFSAPTPPCQLAMRTETLEKAQLIVNLIRPSNSKIQATSVPGGSCRRGGNVSTVSIPGNISWTILDIQRLTSIP